MKILIPTADYPPIEGGIATVARQVARELAALGHEVTVVAPWFPGMDDFDRAQPLRVIRYRGYGLGWARVLPMSIACLRQSRGAGLILAINVASGGLFALAAKRLFNTPYIAFGYGYEFLKFSPRTCPASLLRSVYRNAAFVAAISNFTRDKLIEFGVDAPSIEVCLPGAQTPPQPTPSAINAIKQKLNLNGHRLVLSVGRMVPRKGHLTLVRAMPRVLERHPATVFVCAGRGACRDEAERLAAGMNVSANLRLPGHLDDAEINALYSICDLFALPAGEGPGGQVEGFGLVFAEAAAHGKPVVAGNSGGIPDAVRDGETGLLVKPEDAEATALAIDRLLSDPDLAARMGAAGKRRVQTDLNWTAFTRSLMDALARRT